MDTMQRPSPMSASQVTQGTRINQIMTRGPVCCLRSDSVQHVAAIMRDEDTGLVPVVENEHEGVLVGVVTDRDLCLAILADGLDSRAPVSECMTSPAVTCRPDEPIVRALHLMEQNQIRRVPVVDHQQRVQGIVSLADIVRRSGIDGDTTQAALREICQPASASNRPLELSELAAPVLV